MDSAPRGRRFSQLARYAARVTGHPGAFALALGVVLVWLITGPLFGYSDTWQLVINTATTIITFLMVFLLQNSQNRDTVAMQLKLDELVRAVKEAKNTVLNLEDLEEDELETLRKKYQQLGSEARQTTNGETLASPEESEEEEQQPAQGE
jgi:low affinity Fe/Cu permease